jgi:uncharacterized cupin superfamily protein
VADVNVWDVECEYPGGDPEGYRAGLVRLGPLVGGSMLGATVHELPPGQSVCPYHYHYGEEEWLVVLEGPVVLRTPAGERELGDGETVCFPSGPEGGHKLTNRGEKPVRVLMLSTQGVPSVAVYPDSDKIGVWTGSLEDSLLLRRSARVEYYDGET